jgi:hypothetical protein
MEAVPGFVFHGMRAYVPAPVCNAEMGCLRDLCSPGPRRWA